MTAATLLANRSVIVIPGTSVQLTHRFILSVFDLAWTTLTVLWFAQILPKHFGAMNPDRYLWLLQRPLFPSSTSCTPWASRSREGGPPPWSRTGWTGP